VLRALRLPTEKRTAEQQTQVLNYYKNTVDTEFQRLTQEVVAIGRPADRRLLGAQDLAWALINTPAFLFNH